MLRAQASFTSAGPSYARANLPTGVRPRRRGPARAISSICMRSSPRRARTSTRTTGTTLSAEPNPRPRCGATAWRSTRSRSGRGCCATSARSIPRWTNSAASFASRSCSLRSARWRAFMPSARSSVVRAAEEFGVAHMLSSVCDPGLEDLAAAAPQALRLYQLYVRGDDGLGRRSRRTRHRPRLCRVLPHRRHRALQPARARHRQAIRHRRAPSRARPRVPVRARLDARSSASSDRFKIPLAIKGIATAEDARIALDHGVEWIYVSNHGGRQLDHGRGSMEVLPEVVDAVAGRAKIMIDGSICRGTDIVKAIAAGADLVGIGRMQCFALAAGGQAGRGAPARASGGRGAALPRPPRRRRLCRARPLLSACRRAGERAARLERVSAAQDRGLSLLTALGMPYASGELRLSPFNLISKSVSRVAVSCYDGIMKTKSASKQRSNSTTRVPITTMEEIPILGDREQAELLASLKKAEKDIKAGKGIDFSPKKFKERLISIYRQAKR